MRVLETVLITETQKLGQDVVRECFTEKNLNQQVRSKADNQLNLSLCKQKMAFSFKKLKGCLRFYF